MEMDSSHFDSYYAVYSPSCRPVHLRESCQLPHEFPSMVAVFALSSDSKSHIDLQAFLVNHKEPTDYHGIGTLGKENRAFCWQPCHSQSFQRPSGKHDYHLYIGTDEGLKRMLEELQCKKMARSPTELFDEEMAESSQTESQEAASTTLLPKEVDVEMTESTQIKSQEFSSISLLHDTKLAEEFTESSQTESQQIFSTPPLLEAKAVDEEKTESYQTETQDIVSTSLLPEKNSNNSFIAGSPTTWKSEDRSSINEVTPQLQVQGTPERPPGLSHSTSKKRKARSPSDHDVNATPPSSRKRQSSRQKSTLSSALSSPLSSRAGNSRRNAQETPKRGKKGTASIGPSARWGHTMCDVGKQQTLLIGGQGQKQAISKDSVWMLNTERCTWNTPPIVACSDKFPPRMGHTATLDPQIKWVFVFGGSKNLRWFNDMHVLDLNTWKWSHIEASGMAPTRAYHSCTLFRNELYIFGGVYPNPDPQPDGCSNDIFIFSPESESWYKPVTMGTKPNPRSGHSATLIGDKLVIFGGWDAPVCFNDLHILDLCLMEFSSPTLHGKPPSPRSWHASIALHYNRVLIHGGYNGSEALSDAFIFNLDTLTWTEVELTSSVPIGIRAGHTLTYFHGDEATDAAGKENEPCEYTLAVFGGGDNEDSFFGDLVPFAIANLDV